MSPVFTLRSNRSIKLDIPFTRAKRRSIPQHCIQFIKKGQVTVFPPLLLLLSLASLYASFFQGLKVKANMEVS